MYAEVYLEWTPSNIYDEASLQKSQENFFGDARLGSKFTSGIGFTVGKLYRMSNLSDMVKVDFQKFVIAFLFFELIKDILV